MRLPVEQSLRQDEMRRAAQIKAECVKRDVERTLGDDCAEMLLSALGEERYLSDQGVRRLADKMRRLGARHGR